MLLLSKLHSKLKLSEATILIENYSNKQSFKIQNYDRDTVLEYKEKVGTLTVAFKVTFCRQKFATINFDLERQKSTKASFNELKDVFDMIKSTIDTTYGVAEYSNINYSTYSELEAANPQEKMTSDRPFDRFEYVMESRWKIKDDACNISWMIDYYNYFFLSFNYTVKNPFR